MTFLFGILAFGLLLLFSGYSGKSLGETLRGELGSGTSETGFARFLDVPAFQQRSTVADMVASDAAGGSAVAMMSGNGGSLEKLVAACEAIARRQYPYSWGGGHNSQFAPSGPHHGYDCSGAVSAALHAAGLLKSPRVAAGFMNFGVPAHDTPGPGILLIYANPGHVWLNVNGRDWGTGRFGNRGGADWQTGNYHARAGFVVRRVPIGAGGSSHKRPHLVTA